MQSIAFRLNHKVLHKSRFLVKNQIKYLRTKRHAKMEFTMPANETRGMTTLDRDKFRKTISLPILDVSDLTINSVMPHLKKMLLKMDHLKPVQTTADDPKMKRILLHPAIVKCVNDLPEQVRKLGVMGNDLVRIDWELTYDNWKIEDILRAVLPENQEGLSSYSRIGHIIHVNLRDHLLPYKHLIGEVIQEKTVGCRSVVNKLQSIDNTYRNFQIELLHGEPDYQVDVKENGVHFEFDFSTVYWNPRLASEHERIVKLMQNGDVLYDVFAGVGPFAVPAGKRKCSVYANDLNPESHRWLQHNVRRNKCSNFVKTFNKDGREFILNDVREDLLNRWQKPIDYNIHITMNLPAMAVEFLNAFHGLFTDTDLPSKPNAWPLVHVYCFAKGDAKTNETSSIARTLVESNLSEAFQDNLEGVHFVRNVAPNKDMFRVSFYLTENILFSAEKAQKRHVSSDGHETGCKKLCK